MSTIGWLTTAVCVADGSRSSVRDAYDELVRAVVAAVHAFVVSG